MICDTERIVEYLLSGNMPFTTEQIARKVDLTQTEVIAILVKLTELGYVHMAPLTPNMDIVAPRVTLMDLTNEEMKELCDKIEGE